MNQIVVAKIANEVQRLEIPPAGDEIMPGVVWGDHTHLFTPAFWKTLLWCEQDNPMFQSHRLGQNINEEVAACILGGYGIPAEVGLAAFYRLRDTGMQERTPSEEEILRLLSEPLIIGEKQILYRFARQKSKYLSRAFQKLAVDEHPTNNPLGFRSWLMDFDGIGLKTASWVTRNWFDSDQVAIIDIHIHRAGFLMNIYNEKQSPSKNYLEMEEIFLNLAQGINVRASRLDALIWQEMKSAGNMVLRHIRNISAH